MATKLFSIAATGFVCIFPFMIPVIMISEGYNPFVPDINTRFSEFYNEEKFNSLKVGIDTTDVISLVGEPISKFQTKDLRNIWSYSAVSARHESYDDSDWIVRSLEIDNDGKVKRIQKSVGFN